MAHDVPFRLTPQRAALLQAVRAASDHPTAGELYRRVKDRMPSLGFATVYRTLNLLAEHGEVLELQLGDDAVARYDGNTGHHDHIRCTGCGAIADLSVPLPAALIAQAEQASGYAVTTYELQFAGTCPECTAASVAID